MHLSAAPRRRPVPPFANHTPRNFELQEVGKLHYSSAMFGPTGLAVAPVMIPSAVTGPPKSKVNVNHESNTDGSALQGNPTGSRTDVKSQKESHPTSFGTSVGPTRTSPFVDEMMTQTNLLVLPPSNPSYQMAYFLKTTGPVKEPPIRSARLKRMSSAMRVFKNNGRRPSETLTAAHNRLNEVISEDNDCLAKVKTEPELNLPGAVVPKLSKTGKKYFEIEPVEPKKEVPKEAPVLGSEILESRVSVLVTDQLSTDSLHDWVLSFESPQDNEKEAEGQRGRTTSRTSTVFPDEETVRILDAKTATPVRPLFLTGKSRPEAKEGSRNTRTEIQRMAPLRSHPITPGPVPNAPPPAVPETSSISDPVKSTQIAHPSPRRLRSHPLLLQRGSSDVSGLRFSRASAEAGRSVSDSPGPPPPRSPLRMATQSESLDSMLHSSTTGSICAKSKPDAAKHKNQSAIHVTKEAEVSYLPREKSDDALPSCLRPGSSATTATSSDVFCPHTNRSKSGSSKPLELIDAMVKASQQNTSRRRLRRGAKPEGPRPLDLSITQSQDSIDLEQKSEGYCASPLSIKRMTSTSDMSENYRIISTTASPSPRVSHVHKSPSSKGRRSPTPRPKSTKRGRGVKSSGSTPSRAGSPLKKTRHSNGSNMPSPPPRKELPPTPREKHHRLSRSAQSELSIDAALARGNSMKALPSPPANEKGHNIAFPSPPPSAKTTKSKLQNGEHAPLHIEARMDALERRNRLLEAALMAVLKTGGKLNGCPCHEDASECPESLGYNGLVARDSVRSRVSSASSGPSALDVYLNTRGR